MRITSQHTVRGFVALLLVAAASLSRAAPLSVSQTYQFLDHVTANTVGIQSGQRQQFGSTCVVLTGKPCAPQDPNNAIGTSVTGTQGSLSVNTPAQRLQEALNKLRGGANTKLTANDSMNPARAIEDAQRAAGSNDNSAGDHKITATEQKILDNYHAADQAGAISAQVLRNKSLEYKHTKAAMAAVISGKLPPNAAAILAGMKNDVADPKAVDAAIIVFSKERKADFDDLYAKLLVPQVSLTATTRPTGDAPLPSNLLSAKTPTYDRLQEKERNAIDWAAMLTYKNSFNMIPPANTSLSYNEEFVAKITGQTVVDLNKILDKAVVDLKASVQPKIERELRNAYKQNGKSELNVPSGIYEYFKGDPGYLALEIATKQKVIDALPVDRTAYKAWREWQIESLARLFLPSVVSNYKQAQNMENQAIREEPKNASTPRVDTNYLISSGRMMNDGSGRVFDLQLSTEAKQQVYSEFMAHRAGCDWKNGNYFSQTNPTSSAQCVAKPNSAVTDSR